MQFISQWTIILCQTNVTLIGHHLPKPKWTYSSYIYGIHIMIITETPWYLTNKTTSGSGASG